MSDVFSFDLEDGIASGECPLCFALARDEERWLDSFWREGRQDPGTRRRFYAGGGFCPRHSWRLHELVARAGAGTALADLYGGLADRDLRALDELLGSTRRRGRTGRPGLARPASCSACVAAADALERKVHFLLQLLAADAARGRYARSRGLCFDHLEAVLATAGDSETALYLAEDWRRRLAAVRSRLEHPERDSWTDAMRLYADEQGG